MYTLDDSLLLAVDLLRIIYTGLGLPSECSLSKL